MASADETPRQPKILFMDLECTPLVGYSWKKWDTNIIEVLEDFYVLSFGWQWEGDKEPQVLTLPDFPLYKKEPKNDRDLMQALWDLLDEADVVIGHNSKAFDEKKANARFLTHGFPPPTPYKSVDTLTIARRHFKMTSNKLDDLGKQLGVGQKVKHTGFQMWVDVMNGVKKAWKLMGEYNRQDITLLREVYLKLRPWIISHPNLNLLQDTIVNCPNCGHWKLQRRGFATTRVSTMQRYQCQNCHAWSKGPIGKIVR